MRISSRVAFGAAAIAALLSGPVSAAEDVIRIGAPNWFTGKAAAAVLGEIFQSRYGYDVEILPGGNPEIYAGMIEGDGPLGRMDIHADSWQPGHSSWTAAAEKAGEMAMSAGGYQGKVGLCAPRYTAEALNLKTPRDLMRPEVVSALDRDGDGKVEMWVGAAGWQMSAAYEVKIRDYGLDSVYSARLAPEGEYQVELYDDFANRRHAVFACYEPMSWFAMEYIEYIEEPAYDPARHNLVVPSESDNWLAESKVETGEQVADVRIAWVTSLRERFPRAAKVLQHFAFTNEDMVEFLFLVDIKGFDMDSVARDWVKANEKKITAWEGASG
ncbi:glycine betaine ABC transporter substrate-binding protein [Rhodovulum sp. DZ06]|uniref:glycine betaine ABC transporter substrate-binding protein n=1 Tax=Rhodovulum sp. DZ06 TaxID=3425126 RepID=UPI003D3452EE